MSRSYSSLLSWSALALATSLMLYHTSDRVNALNHHLRDLDARIEDEQRSLHVLKAEWVYLANPARVEAAVHRHLTLQPTEPKRVVAMKDFGTLLPLRDGVTAVAAKEASPNRTAAATAQPVVASAAFISTRGTPRITASAAAPDNRLTMPRTAAIEASNDGIGGVISSLSLRP